MQASEFFRPGGALSRTPGYEYREGQAEMADRVQQVLENGGRLMVEAGTGIGKSWAYLLPALLSKERVVVSTATKALQDQLFEKDLPQLQRVLGSKVRVARVKGRGNYLCRLRWGDFEPGAALRPERQRDLKRFEKWASNTETGDRDEIGSELNEFDFFDRISATSEHCFGKQCDLYDECFLTRVRAEAEKARIVVVNHYLLVADRVVRKNDFGKVLPDYDVVIVDEAHRLERAATSSFSRELTSAGAETLVKDVRSYLKARGLAIPPSLKRLTQSWEGLFKTLEPQTPNEPRVLDVGKLPPEVIAARDACLEYLSELRNAIEVDEEDGQGMEKQVTDAADALRELLRPADNRVVWCGYWQDQRDRKPVISLHAAPVHPGAELSESLFSKMRTAVLTSATLAVGDDFRYVADQLGVASPESLIRPSPFDFRNNARLFAPAGGPPPDAPEFAETAARTIARLVEASRGRALVLFTSWRMLDRMEGLLKGRFPYPLIRQRRGAGQAALLNEFRETPGAVLLGTKSFWEGVDVPGQALSLLVIDKLPFAPWKDPLHVARAERAEAESGRSSFESYSVPEAALNLKQGLGRLIRSGTDQGLAAVLDPRLVTRRYGKTLRDSLPGFGFITELEQAVEFLESLR